MIPEKIRYLINFIIPALLASADYLLLRWLGGSWVENLELQAVMIAHAAILALVAAAIPHYIIHARIQEGFAILTNGRTLLPHELPLRALLGDQIRFWVPLSQPLQTTLCISAGDEWRYIDVGIDRRLAADNNGRKLATHFSTVQGRLEEQLQKSLFNSSKEDPSFGDFLADGQLMNDADIDTFKSKLLSVIEMHPILGLEYGFRPESIQLNLHSIKRVRHLRVEHNSHELEDSLSLKDFDIDALFSQFAPPTAAPSTRS